MFWKPKAPEPQPRKPGITGSGRFIYNNGWTLWDDTHSPGLIGMEKLDELKALVLTQDERSKMARYMIADSIARTPKHTEAEDQEASVMFGKLNAYLADVRQNRFDQLGHWLETNLMRDKDGRVVREDDSRAANYMLAPVQAYLNCLDLWGYGYEWEESVDARGEPALLVHRKHRTSRVILQSELHYVQGKPYRFEIRMRGSSWRFANDTGFFSIIGSGKDEEQIF